MDITLPDLKPDLYLTQNLFVYYIYIYIYILMEIISIPLTIPKTIFNSN
jgi:hypothetical protein